MKKSLIFVFVFLFTVFFGQVFDVLADNVTISGNIYNLSCLTNGTEVEVGLITYYDNSRGEHWFDNAVDDNGSFTVEIPQGNYSYAVMIDIIEPSPIRNALRMYYCDNCTDNATIYWPNATWMSADSNNTISLSYPDYNLVTISGSIENLPPECNNTMCQISLTAGDGNINSWSEIVNGTFELRAVKDNSYKLQVYIPDSSYPMMLYSNSSEGNLTKYWDNATWIDTSSNQSISLRYPIFFTISGHIDNIDNLPSCEGDNCWRGVSACIVNDDGSCPGDNWAYWADIDENGSFELNLISGHRYILGLHGEGLPWVYYCANCTGNATVLWENATEIDGSDNQTISISYPDNLVTISGHIDNLPSCEGDNCWRGVSAMIKLTNHMGWSSSSWADIDENGSFELNLISGYDYILGVYGEDIPDVYYCANCTGNATVFQYEATEIDGSDNQTISLTLPDFKTISGHIDNLPEECYSSSTACGVELVDKDYNHLGWSWIDENGDFTFYVIGDDLSNYFIHISTPSFYGFFSNNGDLVYSISSALPVSELISDNTLSFTLPSENDLGAINGTITIENFSGDNSSCSIWIGANSESKGGMGKSLDLQNCEYNNDTFVCSYEFSGLTPANDYRVEIWPSDGCNLNGGFYNGSETPTPDINNKEYVTVTGNSTTQIDFVLKGVVVNEISGTVDVKGLDSSKVYRVEINAYSERSDTSRYFESEDINNATEWNSTYTLKVEPAEDYIVRADLFEIENGDYKWIAGEFYNNTTTWDEAEYVDVSNGSRSNINFSINLNNYKTINGTIKIDGLDNCENRTIWINGHSESTDGYGNFEVTLNSSCEGIFELKVKPASDYRVWIDLWTLGLPGGFLGDGCIDDNASTNCSIVGDYDLAALVDVSTEDKDLGTIVIGDNYSTINGTITLSGIDDDLYSVQVHAYSEDTGGYADEEVKINVQSGNGQGSYSLKVPSGKNYRIFVDPSAAGFSSGFLTSGCMENNCSLTGDWMKAGRFDATNDTVLGELTLSVEHFAKISGTVNFSSDVGVHEDTYVWIDAWCAEENQWAGTNVYIPQNENSSSYTLRLAPCSSYKIKVWAGEYVAKVVSDTVSLSSGDDKTVNITLTSGNIIGGTVKNATGTGISNVWVEAFKVDKDNFPIFVGSDITDKSGNFTINGLEEGNYTLVAFPPFDEDNSNYIMSFVPNIQTGNQSVTITMSQGISISGNVTVNGEPYSKADVFAWSDNGTNTWFDDVFSWSQVDGNGNFTLQGLAKGRDYVVCSYDYSGSYGNICHTITIEDNGTIKDATNNTISNLGFSFTKGYKIYGYVNGTGYDPSENLGQVAVFNSTNNLVCSVGIGPDGYYETTPLSPGNYTLNTWIMGFEGNITVEITGNDIEKDISITSKGTINLSGTVDISNLSDVYKVDIVAIEKDSSNSSTGLTVSTTVYPQTNSSNWSIENAPKPVSSYTVCAWAYALNGTVLNGENCTSGIENDNSTISFTLN